MSNTIQIKRGASTPEENNLAPYELGYVVCRIKNSNSSTNGTTEVNNGGYLYIGELKKNDSTKTEPIKIKAGYADTAGVANGLSADVINSIVGIKVSKAGYADSAGSAGSAGYADNAGYANSAGSATNAGHANSAGQADNATNAGYADNAGQLTGILPIANGGTGASTAEGARANLGAAAANHGHNSLTIETLILKNNSYGAAAPTGPGAEGQLYFQVVS